MFTLWETLPVASVDDSFSFALAFYEGVSSSLARKLSKALAERARSMRLYLARPLIDMLFVAPTVEILIGFEDGDCVLHLEEWK